MFFIFSVTFVSFLLVSFPTASTGGDIAYFDFNESSGGWTFGRLADWEWGYPSYEIDGNAWETNLGANYFSGSCGRFDYPSIILGPRGS